MWWQIVFWILLVPLVIVELILFLKTRRFSWLTYALAIFTYVIAISYMIDAFDLGKNAVIIILLASSGLMILLGRRLRKDAPSPNGAKRWAAILLGVAMVLLFIVSAIFGRLDERVQPVASVRASEITYEYAQYNEKPREPVPSTQITLLNRTLSNTFLLPVPVPQKEYKICLRAESGRTYDLWSERPYWEQHPEVGPGMTRSFPVKAQPIGIETGERPQEILIYLPEGNGEQSYAPCTEFAGREPQYRIPIV